MFGHALKTELGGGDGCMLSKIKRKKKSKTRKKKKKRAKRKRQTIKERYDVDNVSSSLKRESKKKNKKSNYNQ